MLSRACMRACVRTCVRAWVRTERNEKEKDRHLLTLVVILLTGLTIMHDKINDSFAFHF